MMNNFRFDRKLHDLFQEDLPVAEKVKNIMVYIKSMSPEEKCKAGLYDHGCDRLEEND